MPTKEEIPLVSVIALCYNQAKYAIETLDSIKAQTYSNIQLIIIDDCSTDNSVEVIKQWINESKIDCEFLINDVNLGICKTLNMALEKVKGKYLQIIACDDVLIVDKLETQVLELGSLSKDVGFVYSNCYTINEFGEILSESRYNEEIVPVQGFYFYEMLKLYFVTIASSLIRMDVVKEVGGFNESYSFEDLDFFLKVGKKYKAAYMPISLVKYRILQGSLFQGRKINGHLERMKILNSYGVDNKAKGIIRQSNMTHLDKLLKTQRFTLLEAIQFTRKSMPYMRLESLNDYWLFALCIKANLIYALKSYIKFGVLRSSIERQGS